MSTYTIDFLKFETKRILSNPFFWVVQFLLVFSTYNDLAFFIGKKGYIASEFINHGILAVNEEAILRTVEFSLSATLLLISFLFAGIIKDLGDSKYSEMLLSKPVKTSRLVAAKFASLYVSFIVVNLSVLLTGTWLIFSYFDLAFKPLYFAAHYLIFCTVPVLVWAALVFLLRIVFDDSKIVYPILVFLWFLNMFPSKYNLPYWDLNQVYPASPFFSYGLLINRSVFFFLSILLVVACVRQLDLRRRNLHGISLKVLTLNPKTTGNDKEYKYRSSKLAAYITNFKINISWKGFVGMLIAAILPPILSRLFGHGVPGSSELETIGRVIRTAEVFLPFAILLYSANSLRIEPALNIDELIMSKPRGIITSLNYKYLNFLAHSIIITLAFYVSLVFLVSAVALPIYLKIVAPPVLFYLSLLFVLALLIKNKFVASLVCFSLWAINVLLSKSMPIFLSTFPLPVYYFAESVYLDLNKLEFALISLVLSGIFAVLSKMNYSKEGYMG